VPDAAVAAASVLPPPIGNAAAIPIGT
jgi:hypothetical protein